MVPLHFDLLHNIHSGLYFVTALFPGLFLFCRFYGGALTVSWSALNDFFCSPFKIYGR